MHLPRQLNNSSHPLSAFAAICSVVFLAPAATAQDFSVYYGVGITSNYISKGFTQTEDEPAFQPYVEFGYGIGYFSLWGSNVNFGEEDLELDVGLGVRPTIGSVDLDVGYVQYFYQEDTEDYGEAYVYASLPVADTAYVELDYWYEVYAHYQTAYFGAGMDMPGGFAVSGGIGSDFGTRDLDRNADFGDIGISTTFADYYTMDLRGQFSRIEETRLVGTLSLDF